MGDSQEEQEEKQSFSDGHPEDSEDGLEEVKGYIGEDAKFHNDSEDSEDAMEDDLDEDTTARLARLQNYACPKIRRKALLQWVTQRVSEISREDVDEPDNEETEIRSALMDAVGIANMNAEADLRDIQADLVRLDFQAPTSPRLGDTRSRIRFADSAVTYVLKLEAGNAIASGSASGPSWTLDRVLETNVFDSPSGPLCKW